MRALNKTTHSTGGGATLWRKRILSAGATVATAALFGAAFGAAPAVAAETDTSEAEGRLITFDGGFVDLNDVAELTPAYSATPSGVAESSSPLELSLLDALDIDLGNGLQLFGSNGILQLGALGQYATTEANSAYASAGLVGADGSIAIGSGDPAEGASLDLSPILEQAGLSALLDNARLELGAISSSATVNGSDDPTGDYRIASGQLLLTSPVVAGLSGSLVDVLGQISDPINGLVGADGVIDQTVDPLLDGITSTLNGLLLGVGSIDDLGVTATVDVDLEAAVNSVLAQPITSDDSVVTIDFSTGEVSVDLARLVADTQGGDYDGTLNGLPANTELLDPDLVQAALDGAIGSVFDQLPALLVNAVTDALNSTDVTIEIAGEINGLFGAVNIGTVDVVLSGTLGDFIGAEGSETPTVDASGTTLVGLPVGTIVTPLLTAITDTILPALVTPLSEAITDAGALDTIFRPVVEAANAVLQPVFGLVTNNLLSLTANVQETPGSFTADGSFTTDTTFSERALSLTLLPALSTPLLELSLASSTVRSSAEVVYDPTLEADGPVEAGDETTVSGEGWPPNTEVDVVLIDPTTGEPVEGAETVTVTTDEDGAFTTPYPVPAGVEPGDYEFEGTDGTHTVTTPVEVITTDDSDSSATATAASDDDSTATSDDDSTATAASDDDSTATSDDNSSADVDADASATAASDDDSTATSDDNSSADVDADASATAASDDDSSADVAADADADSDVNGSTATADAAADTDADSNANASASAAASANADDESNAAAQAAAQAAANADASTTASAASDADATAAAASAANADSSSDSSTDVSSEANASAQAAATAASDADSSSDSNAEGTAASEGDASAAAASAAASNADSSSDASSAAATNADSDSDGSAGTADASSNADDESSASANADSNANASASASASANADDESNAAAQAAAQAAANADASTTASAASDADATAAAASAANADSSSDSSTDVSSEANASAQAAATAASDADSSSDSNAEGTATAESDGAATAAAAANADASSDASSDASADSDSDGSSANADASTSGEVPVTKPWIELEHDERYFATGAEQIAYGHDFTPGELVTASMHSTPYEIGTQTADENGDVTFVWNLRDSDEVGEHYVELDGELHDPLRATFDIVQQTGAGGSGSNGGSDSTGASSNGTGNGTGGNLVATGGPAGAIVPIAIILMLAGAALFAVTRRGRNGAVHR